MKSAFSEIKALADVTDAMVAAADSTIEQARLIADLGVEAAGVVGLLLDELSAKVEQLEAEVKALKHKAKDKSKK